MSAQAAAKAASHAAKTAAQSDRSFLNRGAKRDPELYILMAVMSGVFGLAGYYFGKLLDYMMTMSIDLSR